MVRAKMLVLILAAGAVGCAGTGVAGPVPPTARDVPVVAAPLAADAAPPRVDSAASVDAAMPPEPTAPRPPATPRASRSILMKPALVEDLVVAGADSDARILLGAVFGAGVSDGRHAVGLALVFQSIGAPVEAALGVSHSIEVLADGEVVVQRDLDLGQLYHREQGVETLVVPIDPVHLGDIVGADQVEMQLGSSVVFRLGDQNRRDFGELMSKITEDANLVRRSSIAERPLRKGL